MVIPDLAVPYAAPAATRQLSELKLKCIFLPDKTMAAVVPAKPKNGEYKGQSGEAITRLLDAAVRRSHVSK